MSTSRRAFELVEKVRPFFIGVGPEVQGAAIVELTSIWLAGHPEDIREELLALNNMAIRGLTPINAAQLRGEPASDNHVTALEEWRSLIDAPLDGTEIELLIRNGAYFLELKTNGKEFAEKLWQEAVRAKWIDHNHGGWTWNGIAGAPIGWRPIAA